MILILRVRYTREFFVSSSLLPSRTITSFQLPIVHVLTGAISAVSCAFALNSSITPVFCFTFYFTLVQTAATPSSLFYSHLHQFLASTCGCSQYFPALADMIQLFLTSSSTHLFPKKKNNSDFIALSLSVSSPNLFLL